MLSKLHREFLTDVDPRCDRCNEYCNELNEDELCPRCEELQKIEDKVHEQMKSESPMAACATFAEEWNHRVDAGLAIKKLSNS